MRLQAVPLLLVVLGLGANAVDTKKKILVAWDDPNTPQSVVDDAMNRIIAAKGRITHEWQTFKGFAAEAPDSAIEQVKALGSDPNPSIELETIVGIQESAK